MLLLRPESIAIWLFFMVGSLRAFSSTSRSWWTRQLSPSSLISLEPPTASSRPLRSLLLLATTPTSLSNNDTTFDTLQQQQQQQQQAAVDSNNSYKLRRLKDLMWTREALEDVTAAEFACSVERHARSSSRRAVDYEKLLTQVQRRIRDLGYNETNQALEGMGRTVYSPAQRQALLDRMLKTKDMLEEVMRGHELYHNNNNNELQQQQQQFPSLPSLPELTLPRDESDEKSAGPKLYVRDDGTVDWDGALQDQAALRKFGTAVWARINGRDPETIDEEGDQAAAAHKPKNVTAKIQDTPQIQQARQTLDDLKQQLNEMEVQHVSLLNSVLREGQAVANVNLAMLAPEERARIRESAEQLEKMKEKVSFQTLVYELERIYTYLVGEIGNPALNGYIPLQDRLNVAEFGLLESQIENFQRQMDAGESVDADVLAVVLDQVTDFKRRLGIDYYVTGVTFDGEAMKRWLGQLLEKTRKGLAFYVKGIQLFWNDVVFCLSLINRAAQGYTLKPREVRTIRRTFKDVLTFIPFVIILLIPLSPIGHVLVFGAIQRFFPDFFPSCFTEQRQNLLQLYETAEYSEFKINESLQAKLSRLMEAFAYYFANLARSLYAKIMTKLRGDSSNKTDNEQ